MRNQVAEKEVKTLSVPLRVPSDVLLNKGAKAGARQTPSPQTIGLDRPGRKRRPAAGEKPSWMDDPK